MKYKLALTITALTTHFSFTLAAMDLPIASGSFTAARDSLTNYSCPEWFRDAKFGIWAHWGPQAVPRAGEICRMSRFRKM